MKICKIKRIILVFCIAIVLIAMLQLCPSALGIKTPVVLMYHLIEEEPFTELESLFVRPSDFEAHLNMLKNEGYEFLFASEYSNTVKSKSVIITFDDGYMDNYTEMLPVLERCNAKATIFVASGNIGKTNFIGEEELKILAEHPCIEIGSHTVTHALLTEISEEEAEEQLKESKAQLEEIIGAPVTCFSFPEGRFSLKLLKTTGEYYDTAFTTKNDVPGLFTHRPKIPRIGVDRGVSAEELKTLIE